MKSTARGFTLVEVLIALTVLSLGLLGAAAALLDSLRAQRQSLQRMAAAQLVRDVSERIRANPAAARYDTAAAAAGVVEFSCRTTGCDSEQLVAADLAHFAQAADALLPQGSSAIVEYAPAIGAATLDRFVISLRWQDPRAENSETVTLQMLAMPVAG
jgi:type IV pilus assembly protein PilV